MILTCGEYSDYSIVSLVRVLKNFSYEDLNQIPKCKAQKKTYNHFGSKGTYWDLDCNPTELINAGLVEEVPFTELNIGHY